MTPYVVVWNGRRDTDPYLFAHAETPQAAPAKRHAPTPRPRGCLSRTLILDAIRNASTPVSIRDVEAITGSPHATVYTVMRQAHLMGVLLRVGTRQDSCRHYVGLYRSARHAI